MSLVVWYSCVGTCSSLNPSDRITEIIINRIGIYTVNYMHYLINPRAQVFPSNAIKKMQCLRLSSKIHTGYH